MGESMRQRDIEFEMLVKEVTMKVAELVQHNIEQLVRSSLEKYRGRLAESEIRLELGFKVVLEPEEIKRIIHKYKR